MFIQTELTPNPKTVKFIPGKEVSPKKSVNFAKTDDASNSQLAKRLFLVDGVESIFLGSDFISITKIDNIEWQELKALILSQIMQHYMSGESIIEEILWLKKTEIVKMVNFVDDVFTVNQLHIPVNTPINISLSTKDVIHNFKLTELRVSQDAIPGMEIPVWFEATMTSEEFLRTTEGSAREGKGFEIACAELCGLGHYRMKGFLTVHNDEGYAAWLQEQQEYLEEEEDDDWGDDEW